MYPIVCKPYVVTFLNPTHIFELDMGKPQRMILSMHACLPKGGGACYLSVLSILCIVLVSCTIYARV